MRPTIICIATLAILASQAYAETWRGLTVASENRCSSYSSSDYSYPASVESRIVESLQRRDLWTLHRNLLQQHQGNRHRAHCGPL